MCLQLVAGFGVQDKAAAVMAAAAIMAAERKRESKTTKNLSQSIND